MSLDLATKKLVNYQVNPCFLETLGFLLSKPIDVFGWLSINHDELFWALKTWVEKNGTNNPNRIKKKSLNFVQAMAKYKLLVPVTTDT